MQDYLKTPNLEPRAGEILGAISDWNAGIEFADRQIKYCKMASAPLVFYRGTNHLFWADLAHDDRLRDFGGAKTETWLQGDLHAYNFGSFDNDRGTVVYDLNDFDEAAYADYQYDVWRMAVSLVLIARQNHHLEAGQQAVVVDAFVDGYFDTLTSYRGDRKASKVHFTSDNTYGKLDDFLSQVETEYSRKGMLDRWAPKTEEGRRLDLGRSKLEEITSDEREAIEASMEDYRQTLRQDSSFEIRDVARRLRAGTGSLGTPRYYVLIKGGKRPSGGRTNHILDVKRQSRPAAYRFLDEAWQDRYDQEFQHEGRRHAVGYLALTRRTDDHLGWMTLDGDPYSVRERSPYKEALPAERLTTEGRFAKLAAQWGAVLATDHARANPKLAKQVKKKIRERRTQLQDLVRDVAFSYAFQVESDWRLFVEALAPSPGDCADQAFILPRFEGMLPR